MANSREAQFQWDFIEAMTAYGCKAGTAGGCDYKGEEASDAVLDASSDHEKLSVSLLGDEETGRQFSLLILKLLAGRASRDEQFHK